MATPQNLDILNKWRLKSSASWIPLQASLELTNRCNERCQHCYIPSFKDDPKKVLSLHDWYLVLDKLKKAGTLYIVLMGGEAMLSPFFWDILKYSHSKGFHTSMITNGMKIKTQETADKLRNFGIKQMSFSLYSLKPHVHDFLTRVKGSHQKTIKAIELCQNAGLEVGVNALLTNANIDDIFDLEDWCIEKNIVFKADPTITPKLDGNLDPLKLRASKEQLLYFFRARTKKFPKSKPKPETYIESTHVCNAGKGKCAITAYGDLIPCIEIREAFGNLVTEDFSEIWKKESMNKWRNILNQDLKGIDPKSKSSNFCEHCPGISNNECNDPLQPTQFQKDLAQVKASL